MSTRSGSSAPSTENARGSPSGTSSRRQTCTKPAARGSLDTQPRYREARGGSDYPFSVPLADIPVVYVVGAPRSGTTWFQLMLGSHHEVATPVELAFFSSIVASWYETWDQHREGKGRAARPNWGLPAALTEAEFEDTVRGVVERVYRSVLAAKPTASVMVEKEPRYSLYVDTILRTVPHARFVHVVRDGRDAVCSMVRVSREWAQEWAPDSVGHAAHLWSEAVRGALEARQAPAGYMEVRYEDLLGDEGPDLLHRALAFCGVSAEPELARTLYDRYRHGSRRDQELMEGGLVWAGEAARSGADVAFPEGFIGPAAAGVWRDRFGPADRQAFDSVAGDLLVQLGYEPDHAWAKGMAWTPLPGRR
jgi:Sulfotransferase family